MVDQNSAQEAPSSLTATNILTSSLSPALGSLLTPFPLLLFVVCGGGALYLVNTLINMLWPSSWAPFYVVTVPLQYGLWFLVTLCLLALVRVTLKPVLFREPGEYFADKLPIRFALTGRTISVMRILLESLPGYRIMYYFSPITRSLVLQAICGSANIHPKARIGTIAIFDPDHVHIGESTFAGGVDTKYIAHLLLPKGGKLVYTLAPITVGKACFIGAGCVLSGGVTVGDGAVLQTGSVVAPFTEIGPGEVWGGVPARRKKMSTLEAMATANTQERPNE